MERMLRSVRWCLLIVVTAALSACGGSTTRDEPVLDSSATEGASPTTGLGDSATFSGDPLDDPNSLLSTRVVYFDFDSSQVREEYRPVVEAHANYVAGSSSAQLTLEGHADERGTREYNLALGEQRAARIQQLMSLIGVDSSQVELVSYGEERPVAEGHDEGSWGQNRRVEFIYRAR